MLLGSEKRKAVASMQENIAADATHRQTLPGQVFVRMANIRRTIPVDFQTARELSADALLGLLVTNSGQNCTKVSVCLQGRKIQSAEVLRKELRVGDTIWLSCDHLLGGKKDKSGGSDLDDNFQQANTMTQEQLNTPAFESDTIKNLEEDIGDLRMQCQAKCEKMKLFKTAVKNDDDEWEKIFFECSAEDCRRILAIGENGYIDTLADKMDFFNRLPNEDKILCIESFKD